MVDSKKKHKFDLGIKGLKKDDNNRKLEPQFVFVSHFVISPHPPTTIPRLQTNHD